MTNGQTAVIPKIIHYCWYGKNEYSPLVKACMESWKVHLPDWEYVLWNEENFPGELVFARKLLDRRLYAFVSDYMRIYAVWKKGGIYLDTDMEVVRPLNPLLNNTQFIGCEAEGRYSNAICGGIAGAEFFGRCLEAMDNHYKHTLTPILAPELCTMVINKNSFPGLRIYPQHVFFPYNPYDKSLPVTQLMYQHIQPDTLAIHHWAKSWQLPLFRRILRKLHGFCKK